VSELKREEAAILLEHWIEHNESHSKSFRERAAQVQKVSEKAARDINEAADLMDKCTQMLRKAKDDLYSLV
jgi:pyrroloquinoline quinone (PQQ) biosynthesis protein C